MSKQLKCYIGNLDGLRQGLVLADNQKQAAEVAGTTLYGFRQFWGEGLPPKGIKFEPVTLYTRLNRYIAGQRQGEWQKGLVALNRGS